MYLRLFEFYRGPQPLHRDRVVRYVGDMTKGCETTVNAKRKCGTRVLETFKDFLSFLRLDMKS